MVNIAGARIIHDMDMYKYSVQSVCKLSYLIVCTLYQFLQPGARRPLRNYHAIATNRIPEIPAHNHRARCEVAIHGHDIFDLDRMGTLGGRSIRHRLPKHGASPIEELTDLLFMRCCEGTDGTDAAYRSAKVQFYVVSHSSPCFGLPTQSSSDSDPSATDQIGVRMCSEIS
jgi:hypothetical protein